MAQLLHDFLVSFRGGSNFSFDLDHDWDEMEQELTTIISKKENFRFRNRLTVVFGFADWNKKGTLGLVYTITLKRNHDNGALNRAGATNHA